MSDRRLSSTVQNYLVATLRLREADDQPVPLSALAKELSISPISVNDMCRRLQEEGLMEYIPYKGALLTEMGQRHAYAIIRRHRLWEVFLVEYLGFDVELSHDAAHRLEHATSDTVANRLDSFLGYPVVNPQGEPIPRKEGVLPQCVTALLSEVEAGAWVHILQADVAPSTLAELMAQGLRPGAKAQVLLSTDRGLLIEIESDQVALARSLADAILVEHLGDGGEALGCTLQEIEVDRNEMPSKDGENVSLATLKVGQRATVVRLGAHGAVRRRMLDMGVVPGVEIGVIRVAPLGDPIEFSVKGYHLSMRKCEVEDVLVRLQQDEEG